MVCQYEALHTSSEVVRYPEIEIHERSPLWNINLSILQVFVYLFYFGFSLVWLSENARQ